MSFIREDFVSTRSSPLKHDACQNLKWRILFLNLCLNFLSPKHKLARHRWLVSFTYGGSSSTNEYKKLQALLRNDNIQVRHQPVLRRPERPNPVSDRMSCPAGRQSGLHSRHAAVPVAVHPEAMRGRLQRPGDPRLWDPPWWVAARVCAACSNSLWVIVFTSSSTPFHSPAILLLCIVLLKYWITSSSQCLSKGASICLWHCFA